MAVFAWVNSYRVVATSEHPLRNQHSDEFQAAMSRVKAITSNTKADTETK